MVQPQHAGVRAHAPPLARSCLSNLMLYCRIMTSALLPGNRSYDSYVLCHLETTTEQGGNMYPLLFNFALSSPTGTVQKYIERFRRLDFRATPNVARQPKFRARRAIDHLYPLIGDGRVPGAPKQNESVFPRNGKVAVYATGAERQPLFDREKAKFAHSVHHALTQGGCMAYLSSFHRCSPDVRGLTVA